MYNPKFKRYLKTASLLKEFQWQSGGQLIKFVEALGSKKFDDSGISKKKDFFTTMYKQLEECESFAETLEDIRETLGAGIELYYSDDYRYLMSCYKTERKKLRNSLAVLNLVANRK